MTYLIAFEDHIYRRGAITFLRGSVSLTGFVATKDKPPAILLKVTAFDLAGENPQFSPLGYGFLSAVGQSYARKEAVVFTCEDGGLCIGYEALKYPELMIAIGQEFEINFNRAEGKSDVKIPVSFFAINWKQRWPSLHVFPNCWTH